jgi:hypothetical protein
VSKHRGYDHTGFPGPAALGYNTPVPKWIKTIIAVLLLPFCAGAVKALVRLLAATGRAETIWVATIGGAACWLIIFLLLPKPMRIYIFGHELTHAIWAWMFGGKVKKFKVTANGGHVVITKSNFVIALAPYFCPLYVALVVLGFTLGNLVWGWSGYAVWFHLLIGAAYAFHVTLTWHILRTRQTDITSQGYLFSAVIIFLGNIGVLFVGIPLLTGVSVLRALGWWLDESGATLQWLGRVL